MGFAESVKDEKSLCYTLCYTYTRYNLNAQTLEFLLDHYAIHYAILIQGMTWTRKRSSSFFKGNASAVRCSQWNACLPVQEWRVVREEGKTAGQEGILASILAWNPMMLHPDKVQKQESLRP